MAVGVPLAHVVAPWAISRLLPRHGWETGGPRIWNVVGLMPIVLGIAGLVWIIVTAFVQTPRRLELRLVPAFLLTRGPYAFSRNPMYVSELTLWLGWAVFYGSAGVLIGLVVFFAVLVAGARFEERLLKAHFGEAFARTGTGFRDGLDRDLNANPTGHSREAGGRAPQWTSITHFGCSRWPAFSCCFRSACITG